MFDSFADVVSRSNDACCSLVIELDAANTLTLVDTVIEELDGGAGSVTTLPNLRR